MDRCIR